MKIFSSHHNFYSKSWNSLECCSWVLSWMWGSEQSVEKRKSFSCLFRVNLEKETFFSCFLGPARLRWAELGDERVFQVFFFDKTFREVNWICPPGNMISFFSVQYSSKAKIFYSCSTDLMLSSRVVQVEFFNTRRELQL